MTDLVDRCHPAVINNKGSLFFCLGIGSMPHLPAGRHRYPIIITYSAQHFFPDSEAIAVWLTESHLLGIKRTTHVQAKAKDYHQAPTHIKRLLFISYEELSGIDPLW